MVRLSILNNNNQTYIGQSKTSFKGYGAASLKELYLHYKPKKEIVSDGIVSLFEELSAIGLKEKFSVILQMGQYLYKNTLPEETQKLVDKVHKEGGFNSSFWAQDTKAFILGKKGEEIVNVLKFDRNLNCNIDVKKQKILPYIEGGNYFIGKKADGKPYFIGGEDIAKDIKRRILNNNPVKIISEDFNVEPERVLFIPQPNVHIDMGIRPLKGNDVLINDYEMTINAIKNTIQNKKTEKLISDIEEFVNQSNYASVDHVENALKVAGFNTIRVPGVVSISFNREYANFMNAVVHQKENGNLVYITNHCALSPDIYGINFNKIFEAAVKEIPYMEKVYFVKAPIIEGKQVQNFINYALLDLRGGVHCLTAERPDFHRWV